MHAAARERLASAGLRPSRSRIAILASLAARRDQPTAEQVYSDLSPRLATLSRTTVYSTLRLFCEKGLARQIGTQAHEMRFDGVLPFHAHFLCRRCGRLFDLRMKGGAAALPEPDFPAGFAPEHPQLVYSGLCAECARAAEGK